MKCIKNNQKKSVIRVTDQTASAKVATGEWNYCPKSEWKENNPAPRNRSVSKE